MVCLSVRASSRTTGHEAPNEWHQPVVNNRKMDINSPHHVCGLAPQSHPRSPTRSSLSMDGAHWGCWTKDWDPSRGGVSGIFPSWRWSHLIRLHPCPYPRKWGGEKTTKKKQRQESPILRQRLNQAAMATTRSVVPNACLLLQPTAHAPSSRAGAAGSLVNLG